jgi:hypothetical protein
MEYYVCYYKPDRTKCELGDKDERIKKTCFNTRRKEYDCSGEWAKANYRHLNLDDEADSNKKWLRCDRSQCPNCEYDCITDPCPEAVRVLTYIAPIGDLTDEEVKDFRELTDIDNNKPYYELTPQPVFNSKKERMEFDDFIEKFDKVDSSSALFRDDYDYLCECQKIAGRLRRYRKQEQESSDESAKEPAGTTQCGQPADKKVKKQQDTKKCKSKRKIWIIEQSDMGKSPKEIMAAWNALSSDERKEIDSEHSQRISKVQSIYRAINENQ